MSDATRWELRVKRDDLVVTDVRETAAPELDTDQVELAVERFALTANNVTYARWGDPPLNFWGTFPSADTAWGHLPVWGFARVARSRHPGFPAGKRFFGLLPAASHHVVLPAPGPGGFVDTTADRYFPHLWYQTFRAAGDVDDRDDRRTLLRPLYPASFHAADFVAAKAGDGGLTVLLTSASSKVAIGIAHRLRHNENVRCVGFTSEHRREFVTGLGVYDEVVGYPDLKAVTVAGPVVCVDITGDSEVLTALHAMFRDSLVHVALLGWTRDAQPAPELGDPAPEIFFAPGFEAIAVEAEGEDAFFARYRAAEDEFVDATESWLTIAENRGPDAAAETFRSLVEGTHPANGSTILRP